MMTIDRMICLAACLLLVAGLIALDLEAFAFTARQIALRHRLRAAKRPAPADPLRDYLENAASSAFGRDVSGNAVIAVIGAVFTAVFLISARSFNISSSAFMALMAASMPVLALAVKTESSRNRAGAEGISLVTELYRSYVMKDRNIFEALETVSGNRKGHPICSAQLHRLVLRLRGTGSQDEIDRSCRRFAFSVGTLWARMLASCIRTAAVRGTDVSEGLTDLIEQLKSAKRRSEERRRLNSETVRVTLFLVPLLYFGSMFTGIFYLEVSPAALLKNQFLTPEGLLLFSVCAFLFLINLIIITVMGNTRLDY